MKKLSLLLLTSFVLLFISTPGFSQTNKQHAGNVTTEMISNPVADPQISEVIRNLNIARKNEDMSAKAYWESKLHDLTHPQVINSFPNNFIGKTQNTPVSNLEKVLNVTTMGSNVAVSANTISRERVTGEIYAAIAFYGGTSADTVKVYRSVDNGLHFTNVYVLTIPGVFKVAYNGLDIEAVSKGQGDSTFAFLSMSYLAGVTNYTAILRVRQDGFGPIVANLVGYTGTATNKYTGGRITSDNAKYLLSTYIYSSVVLDSTGGGSRYFRSKLARIENPFAGTMTLTMGFQINPNGQYGYGTFAAPDSATFQTDIAFVSTLGDSSQVYTCTVVRGVTGTFNDGAGIYFTRSNNYGVSAPAIFSFQDGTHLSENPRIAATGYLNNGLMVVTRRLYGGGDWDPYYYYCPLINAPIPSFTTNGYVSSSTDTTFGVSVAAKYRGNGSYLFAYNNFFHGTALGNIYIKGYNNGVFGSETQANPSAGSGTNYFGIPDASFRNVNSDSCLVMWSGANGNGSYVTGGCTGAFVGVGNNSTEIKDFRLDQNYPNPFNPATNISYNIPASGLVKIVVYDVLGSEVATLLNENKIAGYYSSVFDGKNLASGAYYYKITFTSSDNNSFSQTRKMMLIK